MKNENKKNRILQIGLVTIFVFVLFGLAIQIVSANTGLVRNQANGCGSGCGAHTNTPSPTINTNATNNVQDTSGTFYSRLSTNVVFNVTVNGVGGDNGNENIAIWRPSGATYMAMPVVVSPAAASTRTADWTSANLFWSATWVVGVVGSYTFTIRSTTPATEGTYLLYLRGVGCNTNDARARSPEYTMTIIADGTAPTTTLSYTPAYAPNFVRNTTTITLSAADGIGSGVPATGIVYRVNGGSWTTYSGSFNVGTQSSGSVLIEYNSTDHSGNVEATKSTTVVLDKDAPTTTLSYTPASLPNIVNATTTFSLSADDGSGSGIASIAYRLNGSSWIPYTGLFNVSSQPVGDVLIEYNSTDNLGFVGSIMPTIVSISLANTPPTTTLSYTPAFEPNGVTIYTLITLSASDPDGVAATAFRLNGGLWTTYISPFNVSTQPEGNVYIEYNSTDSLDAIEMTKSTTVNLTFANIAPSTTLSYTPAYAPNWVNISTTITLSAWDPDGVVAMTFYQLNSSGWTTYNAPFNVSTFANGTILIQFFSIDILNATETIKSTSVNLDKNAPTASISYTPAYTPNFVNVGTTFSINAADASTGESGVASREYRLNGGSWTLYSTPFYLSALVNGTILVEVRATDHVGNTGSIGTITVNLDKNAPTASISYTPAYTPNFVNVGTTFSINAADASTGESGVASREYRLNGGSWTAYGVPFNLATLANGAVLIDARATDNTGNTGTFSTMTVRLDKNAPVTSLSYTPTSTPNFVNGATTFTLSSSDGVGQTGVISTAYRINGGAWIPYSSSFTLASESDGIITIEYNSTDNVGNVESIKATTVHKSTGSAGGDPWIIDMSALGLPDLPIPVLIGLGIVAMTAVLIKQHGKPPVSRIKVQNKTSKNREYKGP